MEQIDLFEEQYKNLEELKTLIEFFHWTGGMYPNGELQYEEYQIDFYKDLAFIVQYRDDTDNNEKIIDNCCELQLVENNLYKIIKIDGKTIGDLDIDNPTKLSKQIALIKSMEYGELWKRK